MTDAVALERFVLRCKYVQEHSLADDISRLRALAKTQFGLQAALNLRSREESVEHSPVVLLPPE